MIISHTAVLRATTSNLLTARHKSDENFAKIAEYHASDHAYRMLLEAANKIEEAARYPEKVAPQSGAYLIAVTRLCNLCFFRSLRDESLFLVRLQYY